MSNEILDQLQLAVLYGLERALVLLITIPPEAAWAVAGLGAALVLTALFRGLRRAVGAARAWLAARPRRAPAHVSSARARAARALAERGTSRAEIARVTGLSRDVVAVVLRAAESHPERSKLPRTARIAA